MKDDEKKRHLNRTITLSEAGVAKRLRVTSEGEVILFGSDDQVLEPETDTRTVFYERPSKIKHQTKTISKKGYGSTSGVQELARHDCVFVLDTNTRSIHGRRVSVTFFLAVRVSIEGGKAVCLALESHAHAFEFHDVQGNPELLALHFIAQANKENAQRSDRGGIALITDSELGKHTAFMARTEPIYEGHLLPEGFNLIYASSDTGKELPNLLIRQCDRQAAMLLEKIASDPMTDEGFLNCPHAPGVSYRYRKIPILDPHIGEVPMISPRPGSSMRVIFRGDGPGEHMEMEIKLPGDQPTRV